MPTKSEWDHQLERIYEGKASFEEVADKLGVTESEVSQRYDRFLKEMLKKREKKLDEIEKKVEDKERKIKSLSEGIKRTDEKLKETEEKLPEMSKLEKTSKEWEERIGEFAKTWKKAKRRFKIILIVAVIFILVLGAGTYFFFGFGGQPAKFKVENLEISPNKVFAGESVTLSLDVMNFGKSAGTYEVSLSLNGEPAGENEVSLDPGESRTIEIVGTVEDYGPIQVKIDGLTDNFVAYRPFPFEGAYAKYEIKAVILPIGGVSGSETYKVTNVTEESYTQEPINLQGVTTVEDNQEYTTSLNTPLSIKDDEWSDYTFIEITTEETEFGSIKLQHYRREVEKEEGIGIRHIYLEENTRIPIHFEFKDPKGLVTGDLVETNVEYLNAK